jgi:stage II sporulation protein E
MQLSSRVKNWRFRAFFRAVTVFSVASRETAGLLLVQTLLARLHLLEELAPFGFAFWVVAGKGQRGRMVLFGVTAVLAALSSGDAAYALSLIPAMLFFCFLRERRIAARLPLPVLAGLALPAGTVPLAWFVNYHTYDLLLLGFETVLAVFAVIVFRRVFRQPLHKLNIHRHTEEITAWIVFLGLVLLSLTQGGAYLSWLAGGAARALVLWASFLFGPGMAAAAGALLGFLLGVQGQVIFWLGILSFAGFLSGLFRPYGRIAVAGGFFLGASSLALHLAGWEAVPVEAALSGSAAAVFLLAPVLPLHLRVQSLFAPRGNADEGRQLRDLTSVRIKDCAHVFRELSHVFRQTAAVEASKEQLPAPLLEELVRRVCKGCPAKRSCWEQDLQRTYNAVLRLLAELESGQAMREIKYPAFFQSCREKENFLQTLAFLQEKEGLNKRWQKKLAEGRDLVSLQLSGLSQILHELACEVRDSGQAAGRKVNAAYHVELGVAQAAKNDHDVSGDYYSYLELRDGRQVFILSDGMGSGGKACRESQATVQLVEQLLLAGFRRQPVIRTVNTILQLRSREESFATLDILQLDPYKGKAEFLKIGAAPSFLCARNQVREIRTPSIPLGILSDVELKQVTVELEDDTIFVMVSDGIFEVRPFNPDWLKKYLAGKLPKHPQVLADEIIHYARKADTRQELRDDITVLVCHARRLTPKIRDYATG